MTHTSILITQDGHEEKTLANTELETMYALLNCSSVTVVPLKHNIYLWVDEEGSFKEKNHVTSMKIEDKEAFDIVGNILILSVNDSGETEGLNEFQLEWVRENVKYREHGTVHIDHIGNKCFFKFN